jgi:DNA-directed RNA polymerase subunit M/transcription elongation factor TFIIS
MLQIQLRQHDILLKRQFCDIQDTIRSMKKTRVPRHESMSSTSSLQSTASSVDITMENYGVRTATSATLLQNCEDCAEDTLSYTRPRTSSMKTTRDLAALARRRGSKELI